jgi:D-serine deaminase-like pyridoxal phosphate-dependent protein
MKNPAWSALDNPASCISPSLLVYPERVEENIGLMIRIAGGTDYLRPHIKTHKMAEIITMQMARGIGKFKCATIAEAELAGSCNAPDVMLAIQPVGPNITRFLELVSTFKQTLYSTILDDIETARILSELAAKNKVKVNVFMDVNVGMERTGVIPGKDARILFKEMHDLPSLEVQGLHVYDGHIRHSDLKKRTEACNTAFRAIPELVKALEADGLTVNTIVAGGSPTFPIHSKRQGVETSPGTTLLWDDQYATLFPDMPFLPAAVLFSRVISKPGKGLICLDAGHKAVAAEMPFPRLRLLGSEPGEQLSQSEEHLVLRHPGEDKISVGDHFYALPVHVCPTVAKHSHVFTVINGKINGKWRVAARDRHISI